MQQQTDSDSHSQELVHFGAVDPSPQQLSVNGTSDNTVPTMGMFY